MNIEIPDELCAKIEERLKQTDFRSISEYITYILDELMLKLNKDQEINEDEAEIKKRLTNLGYIN